jgi:hypothetical protein
MGYLLDSIIRVSVSKPSHRRTNPPTVMTVLEDEDYIA